MSARRQSPWVWQRHGGTLAVVRASQALVVPDHVPQLDPERAHQPERQGATPGSGAACPRICGRSSRLLDPERRPVQPDGVPADRGQADELVDRPVAVDHEVRADAGSSPSPGRVCRRRSGVAG